MTEREQENAKRHCHRCELPKPACACADATAYDNWWRKYGNRDHLETKP